MTTPPTQRVEELERARVLSMGYSMDDELDEVV
jgi:hypothetical protein